MNPVRLLQLPWYAGHRSLRWMTVLIFALCCGGALAIALFGDGPRAWLGATMLYGVGLFFLCTFFLPLGLLLGIDARLLRVPGVQRLIPASVLLYGALGLALPLAVLASVGQPLLPAFALLAVAGTGGLLFALTPRYLAVMIGLTPSLLNQLWRHFALPGLTDPRMVGALLLLIPMLLLLIAWRWQRLLRTSDGQPGGWTSPMVLQYRSGSWGYWGQIGSSQRLRQRPDWLRPSIDLDGAGPARPRRALRVALGGWYLPQSVPSYVRQLGISLAIGATPVLLILLLGYLGRHDRNNVELLQGSLIGILAMFGALAGPMISALSLLWLGKRWQRANGELPLLALLPGLGDRSQLRRQLLRAVFGLPLLLHALTLALIGLGMVFWHDHAAMLSFLLLTQLGSTAITVAALLNLLGGRALSIWSAGALLTIAFALTLLSLVLPTMAWGSRPVASAASTLPPLVLAWLLFGAALLWLGWRGWHGLRKLPHPFLARP